MPNLLCDSVFIVRVRASIFKFQQKIDNASAGIQVLNDISHSQKTMTTVKSEHSQGKMTYMIKKICPELGERNDFFSKLSFQTKLFRKNNRHRVGLIDRRSAYQRAIKFTRKRSHGARMRPSRTHTHPSIKPRNLNE